MRFGEGEACGAQAGNLLRHLQLRAKCLVDLFNGVADDGEQAATVAPLDLDQDAILRPFFTYQRPGASPDEQHAIIPVGLLIDTLVQTYDQAAHDATRHKNVMVDKEEI